MSEVKYHSPEQNIVREEMTVPFHTFEVLDDQGEVISRAEVEYFSEPIPHYQISHLYTEVVHQGKGYASKVMDAVEAFLKDRKRAGLLVDGIDPESPAAGFYERRGWTRVGERWRGQYVFNLPKSVNLDKFIGIEMRQTPFEEREGRQKKTTT